MCVCGLLLASLSLSDRPQEDTGTSWATFVYIRSVTAGRSPLERPNPAHKQSPKPCKLIAKQTCERSKASAVNNTHMLIEEKHTYPACLLRGGWEDRRKKKKKAKERKRRENSMPPVWLKPSRLLSGLLCFELNSCESLTPALNPRTRSCRAALRSQRGTAGDERERQLCKITVGRGRGRAANGPYVHHRRLVPRSHVFWAQDQRQMWVSRRDETSAARLKQK